MTELQQTIVKTARNWIGQEENKGNMGFKDADFDRLMRSVGFKNSQAWCAYFVKLVWLMSFVQRPRAERVMLNAIMGGGAVASFNSFEDSDFLVSEKAIPGSLVYWQKYRSNKASWMGHAGVVVEVHDNHFKSVEGNTNPQGGREGYTVSEMTRYFNFKTENGLRLLGFVHPVMKPENNTLTI
jgi:hypothetical protein